MTTVSVPTSTAATAPAVIAHRGDRTTGYTEESLNALVLAAESGADYIEFDVQVSSNGVLYAMHDATLARTVKGSPAGGIKDYTSTLINAMRLNDGSPIPHVSTVLDAVKPHPVQAFIEIKVPRADTYSRLRTRVIDFGASRVIIQSFSPAWLDAYKAVAPTHRRALISSVQRSSAVVAPYRNIVIDYRQATPVYVAAMKAAGYGVYVYTPNTTSAWHTVPDGVNGVMTDQARACRLYAW
jgi:glycerophosphoryl diester phosphodiesterase